MIVVELPALAVGLSQRIAAVSFASDRLPDDPRMLRRSACLSLPKLVGMIAEQSETVIPLATEAVPIEELEVRRDPDPWTPTDPEDPLALYLEATVSIVETVFDYEREIALLGELAQSASVEASADFGAEIAVLGTEVELLRIRVATLRRLV